MEMADANVWLALGESIGHAKQATATVLAVVEAKFGSVPRDVRSAVHQYADATKLSAWTVLAATAATLDEFRAAVGI